jgi:hypothetical protein
MDVNLRHGESGNLLPMQQSRNEPRHRSWRRALMPALLLRLIYSAFAATVAVTQTVNWRLVQSNALTENLPLPDHGWRYLLFGVWNRFDTLWYLHIAAHGYDRPEAVVFFPLYPSLIKLVSLLVPPMAAALLISTSAAFFLFWGLQELLMENDSTGLVTQSVWLCSCWPAGFVFFAGYPESLLAALITWSLWMAGRDRWLAAAGLGLAATLSKAVGVVVLVPLLIIALRTRKTMSLAIVLIPAGAAAFLGYLHWTGHTGLVTAYAQYWRTVTAPPWTVLWMSLQELVRAPNAILVLNLLAVILVCALAAISRLKIEYLLFSAAAVIVPLCKETMPPLQSMMRYQLIIFPAFVGTARLLQRRHSQARWGMVCAAFLIINLGLLWLFVGWSLVV